MTAATHNAGSRPVPRDGDTVLVDPGWLAEHLNDADVHVVEVDVSPQPMPSSRIRSCMSAHL